MNPSTRILLVEDDATSRAFMTAVLEGAGLDVDCAASMRQALAIGATGAHALWLVDAHLPDGSGVELLTALRTHAPSTPALAHTASHDTAVHDALRAAGFAQVIVKPLTGQALLQCVRAALDANACATAFVGPTRCASPIEVWNDADALRALNGQHAHVATLRALFVEELPGACERIGRAVRTGAGGSARDELHKLQASCGFVGAARLAAAVRQLSTAMSNDALAAFEDAVRETLGVATTAVTEDARY